VVTGGAAAQDSIFDARISSVAATVSRIASFSAPSSVSARPIEYQLAASSARGHVIALPAALWTMSSTVGVSEISNAFQTSMSWPPLKTMSPRTGVPG
jgi:hypothetical protein